MRILVTGANGFVGSALVAALQQNAHSVRRALRNGREEVSDAVTVGDINSHTDWSGALRDIDVVIHLAARVHVMHESAADPLAAFREVNVAGTETLARQAAEVGVKRLVYVSSIKVNGEGFPPLQGAFRQSRNRSQGVAHAPRNPLFAPQPLSRGERGERLYRETDSPAPQDPYGISKWEAEQALHRVAAETGLEVVIVRPPLVYGAGVKGNFAQMLKALARGMPLPFASVHNRRSLLHVGNLADALLACATHPAAAGQTYLVSDGEDISTSDLLHRLGAAMGRPARLFSCPTALLQLAGKLSGRSAQIERLLGSLQIDSGKIRRELGWKPPFTLEQGLQATADWYRSDH